jgi:hypothetical protein
MQVATEMQLRVLGKLPQVNMKSWKFPKTICSKIGLYKLWFINCIPQDRCNQTDVSNDLIKVTKNY